MDRSALDKIDRSGMCKAYDQWPRSARDAYEKDLGTVDFEGVEHIVFSGMGGSGAIGDLFESILSKTSIHVSVVKGYVLPSTISKNSLVVCISISGNTIETLSVLKRAHKLHCKLIAFSSGNKMESFCTQNNIIHKKIPMIHSPRASFGAYVYSILNVLRSCLPVSSSDVLESISRLEETALRISSSNLTKSNPSLDLAGFISEIPAIYYPYGMYAAAIRFKNSLQENAKMHAFVEDVIEMCHNGIVAWEKGSRIKPILIRGVDDHINTKERWEILKQYFAENRIRYREILSEKGSILTKIMCLVYLLDYCSVYKAVLEDMDPSPVHSIRYIKSKLG